MMFIVARLCIKVGGPFCVCIEKRTHGSFCTISIAILQSEMCEKMKQVTKKSCLARSNAPGHDSTVHTVKTLDYNRHNMAQVVLR